MFCADFLLNEASEFCFHIINLPIFITYWYKHCDIFVFSFLYIIKIVEYYKRALKSLKRFD